MDQKETMMVPWLEKLLEETFFVRREPHGLKRNNKKNIFHVHNCRPMPPFPSLLS